MVTYIQYLACYLIAFGEWERHIPTSKLHYRVTIFYIFSIYTEASVAEDFQMEFSKLFTVTSPQTPFYTSHYRSPTQLTMQATLFYFLASYYLISLPPP